ncbi:MAG: histidinol-phosphate transaminase [Elusimicrobiota bacterium]|jgi:histidinol-phosphate aminotransferase|nr:histidinol-phosphate transaminase [Elusimicrobiota bacterium]
MDIAKLIRKNCQGFEPYVAGKPIETIKRELKLKKIVKLASNENPIGPSKKAVKAIKDNAAKAFFYPDSNSYTLKHALSSKHKLPENNIFTAAGGDEIIELVARLFFNPSDEIIISQHSFVRYEMAARLMNSKPVIIPMREGFIQDLPAMAKACSANTKAIFITNPNNPTGTYNSKAALSSFLASIKPTINGQKPLIIIDEAYFEYGKLQKDYPDSLEYLKKNENLIILRTFSKIYGLAGLRVGYGFAHKDIVDYIERIRPPFNVNSLAQAAAVASLSDSAQIKKGQSLIRKEKEFLEKELKKLAMDYVKSAANFILIKSSPLKGKDLFVALLKKGVIVRAMDEYELPDWIRLTIGLHDENKMFIDKIKEVLNK